MAEFTQNAATILGSILFGRSIQNSEVRRDLTRRPYKFGNRLIVCEDFNTIHTQWWSRLTTTEGRKLHEAAVERGCHLLTGEATDLRKPPHFMNFFN